MSLLDDLLSKKSNTATKSSISRADALAMLDTKLSDEDLRLIALFVQNATGLAFTGVRSELKKYLASHNIPF